MAVKNSLVNEVKVRPDVFHFNDDLLSKVMASTWNEDAINVTDYGAILSGKYVYIVPIIMDIEVNIVGHEMTVKIGKVQTSPIKRNLENFLHPTGCIITNKVHEIIGRDDLPALYGFYYNSDNFVSSSEINLVYLNITEVHSPNIRLETAIDNKVSPAVVSVALRYNTIHRQIESEVCECITKALKQV